MDKTSIQVELEKIDRAIAAQEALSGTLPDEQLSAGLDLLRRKQEELVARLDAMSLSAQATVSGGGTVAQGVGNRVVGEGGVLVDGDVDGDVIGTQNIYQSSADHSWIKLYLEKLISICDPLDLSAVDEYYVADPQATPIRIKDVFTSLYLAWGDQSITRRPGQPVVEVILKSAGQGESKMREREEEEVVSALEAIAAMNRLVILGYPGGGKSTLVNYLAGQMARRCLGQHLEEDALSGWPVETTLLPVRIILRHFAARLPDDVPPGPKGGLVWDYLEETLLPQWGCREALPEIKQILVAEGGLVLFDGLDEVPESIEDARRSLIKEAITDFAAPLGQCKVIVTCREYAYKEGDAWRLPEQAFPQVELALFASEQIEQFTRTWYGLTGPMKGWDSERCRKEAENLFAATQKWPHLQELAPYPLLLTLMAQVHGRDGTLPDDRADLYDRAVNLLLAHWENRIVREAEGGRRIEPGLIMQLGVRTETLKSALARVAFQAHEQQEQTSERDERAADISRDALWEELQAVLGSYDQAKLVTDYIQDRAGLLQARDRFTYTFPHRTFQEYLAALHVWKEANPGETLAVRVKRDLGWWREVFLLAAGQQKGTPKNVTELVEWLLPVRVSGKVTPTLAQRAVLTGQALRETVFAQNTRPQDPDYRFTETMLRVKAWLEAAMLAEESVPVRDRAAAGRELGRLSWPDGRPLDDRMGIGFLIQNGIKMPSIAWGEIVPAGKYLIGDKEAKYSDEALRPASIATNYRLARYPVTVAQFACFAEAKDVDDDVWWLGMPREEKYKARIAESWWPFSNRPRETVSWYQAIAFCRWLNHHLKAAGLIAEDEEIDLPLEEEWEVAARYAGEGQTDRRIYPWGSESITPEYANYGETGLRETSAVGIFPAGQQPKLGLYDLSGNVWEWCRNKYGKPEEMAVDEGGDSRVLRGGSWNNDPDLVRAASRYGFNPNSRFNYYGFRVVRRLPSHSDH
jgi:formylglycine-generating enzyme required for sulfatase activity/energy-coupling factor transporter ATP-binding protein EcfA2